MRNKEVAQLLQKIAELLAFKEENIFKIRAYEKAAQTIEYLGKDIAEELQSGNKIAGVGESIAEKIKEYLSQGKITYLEELKKEIPPGLLEIMDIPGLGPRRAKLLYEKLGIKNVAELKQAAQQHRLQELESFGQKLEENILKGLKLLSQAQERMLISTALEIAERIIAELKKAGVKKISEAGSLRRRKETIRDIDILVASNSPEPVMKKFCSLGQVQARGETKASILTAENIQVDLRVVKETEFGSALQYFTGSKEHNIALRKLAITRNKKISEYGLFDQRGKKIAGESEEEIYHHLGLDYIPPELREDQGEIDLAKKHCLPTLLNLSDIQGDLHIHSNYSDGHMTIAEIVHQARQLGYRWVSIADHSQSLKVARGLSPEQLNKKIQEIKNLRAQEPEIEILIGSEVDILSDGKLDYPEEILKQLDVVIAAVHSNFKQDENTMTERIIRAMKNPYVHIISHPTGRLLNRRSPYAVNIDRIIEAAADYKVALEINAFPERLDLPDIWCRRAKEKNVLLAIGSDAHFLSQMEYLRYGVFVARRGWLSKKDLVNTRSVSDLKKLLTRRR